VQEANAEAGERILRLRIPARADRLRLVRTLVSEAAVANGCSERCVHDMVIAVDEACQNVIRHAYGGVPDGEMSLEIRRDGDRLLFSLVQENRVSQGHEGP
jgi:sigma-B regulation protein RsbU (phosphoserine phosphatase)